MSGYKKRASYRDYANTMQKLLAALATDRAPRIILLQGSSEYLTSSALKQIRDTLVEKTGATVSPFEAPSLSESSLAALFEQGSLFEPASIYVVRRCEQAKSLPKLLKGIASAASGNFVVLVAQGESASALQTEVSRLKGQSVPCFDPWPNELGSIVAQIAANAGTLLKPDAINLLIEVNGADLAKLGNEVQKLSLIFAEQSSAGKGLTASDVAPHLGMLREDDAFELDRLLLAKQWAKAQALLSALLERGEKGIALLGILSNHCRNGVKVSEALRMGLTPDELTGQMRLPPFILKAYMQAVGRTSGPRYAKALRQCRDCDLMLKTSAMREDLILSRIIEALSLPNAAC